jgi:hypothetical protein
MTIPERNSKSDANAICSDNQEEVTDRRGKKASGGKGCSAIIRAGEQGLFTDNKL